MNILSSEQSDSRLARAGEWTFFQLSSISTPDVHTLGVVLFCPDFSLARIARGTFLSRISWMRAGYWLLWAATGSTQSGVGAWHSPFDPDSPSVPTPRGQDRRDGVRRHVHSDETLGFRGSVERPPLMVDPFTNYKDFCRTQSEADVAVSVRSGGESHLDPGTTPQIQRDVMAAMSQGMIKVDKSCHAMGCAVMSAQCFR